MGIPPQANSFAPKLQAWLDYTSSVSAPGSISIPEDSVNFGALKPPTEIGASTSQKAQLQQTAGPSTSHTQPGAGTTYLSALEITTSGAPGSNTWVGSQQGDDPSRVLLEKGVSVLGTDAAYTQGSIKQLVKQLDRFKQKHRFLGQFEMLGRSGRRKGGVHSLCF